MPETRVVRADIAVVGAGPAGIAAAACAAERGASVVVVDEGLRPGGQIWRHRDGAHPPRAARRWLDRFRHSGASLLSSAAVVDAETGVAELQGELTAQESHGGARLVAEQAGDPWVIEAGTIIVATGARELLLPFPGWTLPGVVGVGGAQALLKAGARVKGLRAVVAGTGPLLLPVAAALARAGARVELLAEQASAARVRRFARSLWRTPGRLLAAARYRLPALRAPYARGMWVVRAEGVGAVKEAVLSDGKKERIERCDLLCVGYGLVPAVELPRLLGCTLRGGRVAVDEFQRTSVPGVYCAGEPTGVAGVEAALLEGQVAGLAATGRLQEARPLFSARSARHAFARRLDETFALRAEVKALAQADTIVCRCEDVPFGAVQELGSAREAKLYTRAGMGSCQGRICGAALRELLGWDYDTVRAPLVPAAVGTLIETTQHPEGVAG